MSRTQMCSTCRKVGHNARTCGTTPTLPPAIPPPPPPAYPRNNETHHRRNIHGYTNIPTKPTLPVTTIHNRNSDDENISSEGGYNADELETLWAMWHPDQTQNNNNVSANGAFTVGEFLTRMEPVVSPATATTFVTKIWHHNDAPSLVAQYTALLEHHLPTRYRESFLTTLATHPSASVREIAANASDISPEILTALSRDSATSVRRVVAYNPSTPTAVLADMVTHDTDFQVHLGVAQHPAVSPQTLTELHRKKCPTAEKIVLHQYLAGNPSAPPELLTTWSRYRYRIWKRWKYSWNDFIVRREAIENPSLPIPRLTKLATSRNPDVRYSVARNPSLPTEIIPTLTNDPSFRVRGAIARHPRTPPENLTTLARDTDRGVRRRVARRTDLTPELVNTLTTDEDSTVRAGIADNPSIPTPTLQHLTTDSDELVSFLATGALRRRGIPTSTLTSTGYLRVVQSSAATR